MVAAIGCKACRYRACRARSPIAGIDKGRRVPFFLGISLRFKGTGRERCHRPLCSTAWAFFSGVSQRSPSTPGVFVPVFSVTRLPAKARAAHECTNRELRRLTLRQAPAWTAWTLRRCRERTRRWQAAQFIRCHALVVRSEDACRSGLLMVHRASVRGLPRRSRPITPVGSQPPFGVGQSLHPSPPHSRVAFASSHVPYRLRHLLCLRSGDAGGLGLARPQRAHPAYHVWRVSPTSRGRMPLCTGRVDGCVGSPFNLTDLPSVPFWRWGRMVALAPPASRCVIPRLQFPSPYRPFPDDEIMCHSPLIVFPSA
jgi:hypothetical protein